MHVLVIDDEPVVRQILASAVAKGGYSVDQAASAAEAASKLSRGDVDVALCDIKLPDGSGIDLVRNCRESGIETTFLMVTAFASMETAIEALRAGATDYITKPVHNEEILHRLAQMEAIGGLRAENTALRRTISEAAPGYYRFASPCMAEVDRLVGKVARTSSTVLITGESGTGKGVVARQVHEASERRDGQFVAVNCSAIPEQLMEAEFFGHTKGAFTGADRARKGLFLQADKGTLLLDEIGELPLHMQSKLLNVIEEKEVRPIGSEVSRHVDVRIIAATNRDLVALVSQGRFREDLYFRLSMFQIPMPALRERREDIPGLIRFLLRGKRHPSEAAAEIEIDPLAEEVLLSYPWPGNVRELDNVVNRAKILAEDNRITVSDLPSRIIGSAPAVSSADVPATVDNPLRERVRRFEVELMTRAVEEAGGDRRLAAQRLGISLSTLYRKLEDGEHE
jgi:DNA-binding NtrC family response regulator